MAIAQTCIKGQTIPILFHIENSSSIIKRYALSLIVARTIRFQILANSLIVYLHATA